MQCDFFGQEAPVKNGKNGVLIVRYPNGRASGDAFALFNDENDIEEAMKRDREDMMGRYVELFTSSLKEFLMVCYIMCTCDNEEHGHWMSKESQLAIKDLYPPFPGLQTGHSVLHSDCNC